MATPHIRHRTDMTDEEYQRACDDLNIIPEEGPVTTTPAPDDLTELIRQQVAEALKQGQIPAGALAGPEPVQVIATFDDILAQVNPRDSEAALAMYTWLHKNGRLHVIGTLQGAGYLETYQEPKGTTKAGYAPGSTTGGRMVDAAVEKTQASGVAAPKRGLCPHCFSAVRQVGETIVLDDDPNAGLSRICNNSPDGLHGLA